jgi:hypothetical protein
MFLFIVWRCTQELEFFNNNEENPRNGKKDKPSKKLKKERKNETNTKQLNTFPLFWGLQYTTVYMK